MWPLAFGAVVDSRTEAHSDMRFQVFIGPIYFFCKYLYYIHMYVLFLFEAIHLHTKEIKIHKHLPKIVFQNQFKPILDSDFKTVSRRPQKRHPPAAGKNIVYATQRSLRLVKSTTYHNYDIRIGGITQKIAGHHEREPLTDL